MSMTREEAISSYEKLYDYMVGDDDAIELDYGEFMELNHYIRSALRPVSREQVKKVWPGCDACEIPCNNCESIYAWDRYGKPQECTGCPENGYKNYTPESQFCEFCGRPLTDEAVQMVMERMEAMKDGKGDLTREEAVRH